MTVNVTLVNPPYPENAHQHPSFIPLGIAYLRAVLEKNGYSVNVIDCQAQKLTHVDLKREIGKHQPKIVGLTSSTLTYKSALKVAEIAKQVNPDCVTILGGCHATFWDDKALEECPQLDVIVRKEGEYTLLEIADRLKENKQISDVLGTTCRKDGKILKNPDRPYVENLDDLPFPAHHLELIGRLRKNEKVIFPITTSRGCVYWCDFCTAVRMFGRKLRLRSPKNVIDEIEFLHNTYGADMFSFYDDAFTFSQSRTEEMCQEIINRKLKVKWNCQTRVDMVTKKLLLEMREAGCTDIWFGIESGSQPLVNAMGKGISIEQTMRAFKWAKEAGLMTVGFVILGFPGETKETIWETVKLVGKINPNDVVYHVATPYPGTPMADFVKKNGWLKITDFDKYDTATPIFETPMLSMKELREIREKALQRFYLSPAYIRNMLANGGLHDYTSRTSLAPTSTRLFFAHLIRAIRFKLQSQ